MAMTCVYEEQQYSRDGKDIRRAYILADETPATMPTTGENVDRLPDTTVLDTGSVLKDLDAGKKYVLYGTTWHEDAEGSSE